MVADHKQEIRNYWNKTADSYSSYLGHGFSGQEEIDIWRNILDRNIPRSMRGRALDLGTGPGIMALMLAMMGFEVTGLDLSEEMLRVARKNASEAGLSIVFEAGDAENPPFAAQSFDLIICRHIMWTLPKMHHALQHWGSILKPGGGLTIIDGLWYPHSINGRFRRLAAYFIEAVKNRKFSGNWRKKYISNQDHLPFLDGAPLEIVEKSMAQSGFSILSRDLMPDLLAYERRHFPLEYRIQYCHTHRYLIFGQKSS